MTKVTQISLDENGAPSQRRIHLREISDDSESPLETVGQDLRAARLRRGEDLATVSRALKIRKDHLESVEEGDLAALPGKTYALGFVRSYAGYLGLDVSATLERYRQEIAGRHDDHTPSNPGLHAEETRRLPSGWRILAGVVGVALIYGVWHLLSAGPAPQPVPPAPSLAPPHPQVADAAPLPAPPPAPTPSVPATGDSAAPPPALSVTPPPSQPAPPPSGNSGLMASGVAASPSSMDKAEPSPAVPAVPAPAGQSSTQAQVFGRLNVNPRVVLRAHADTRLTVKGADGTLYLNHDLKSGDTYQVPNITGLSMATSDAGAVEVVVDGNALGRVGQNQQVLGHVSLDPGSLADRFQTH